MTLNKYTVIAAFLYSSVFLLYTVHFVSCSQSSLPGFSVFYTNSDMHANVKWAESILEQGFLNPQPFHPYNDWMLAVGPLSDWVSWWGGAAVFQQSPLYTYVLALILKVTGSLLVMHIFQLLCGFMLCVALGAVTRELTNNRIAGMIAFTLAGLYGPYFAYAWPLLRDMLSWLVIALFALVMMKWWRKWDDGEGPSVALSAMLGVTLALGLLTREVFYLIALIVFSAGFVRAFLMRRYLPVISTLLVFTVCISPLMVRNGMTGAPLLSTSNRFAEAFILFNVPAVSGTDFMVPVEMKQILEKTNGRSLAVVTETLALYKGNYSLWLRKMGKKVVALLDPFESPDNINLYYMQLKSSVVRYGIPHWIIIVPGICGLMYGLLRRDRSHFWLWILFLCLFANVLLFAPISRYRQTLSILWIPWAAYYIHSLASNVTRKSLAGLALIPVGWAFCLYISPKHSPSELYRSAEFIVSEKIYTAWGQKEKARAERELLLRLTNPDSSLKNSGTI